MYYHAFLVTKLLVHAAEALEAVTGIPYSPELQQRVEKQHGTRLRVWRPGRARRCMRVQGGLRDCSYCAY